jgi:hypothetical protein
MTALLTQQDFRRAQTLPFCYLCGIAFEPADARNRDHVPPTSVFDKKDRDVPLVLPTHPNCNAQRKLSDERIAQVIALKRGHAPSQRRNRHLRFRTCCKKSHAC